MREVGIQLFIVAILGILSKKGSLLHLLMGLELLLLAANLILLGCSFGEGKGEGEILALILIVCAGAEITIALALLVFLHREKVT